MPYTKQNLQNLYSLSLEDVDATLAACGLSLDQNDYADEQIQSGFDFIRKYINIYQNLSAPELSQQPIETSSFRELQLKIQLAQIELEREKLRHEDAANTFPVEDIDKVGIPPWQVIYRVQKSLGWSDAEATCKLLDQLGYGLKSDHWFNIPIVGNLSVMSWSSVDSLFKAIEQFKASQN